MTYPSARTGTPRRIKQMRPDEVRSAIKADPRLIIPVGTCEQHGRHLPLGADTPAFAAACDAAGLVVRPYATDGVRVTIGETEANDRILELA